MSNSFVRSRCTVRVRGISFTPPPSSLPSSPAAGQRSAACSSPRPRPPRTAPPSPAASPGPRRRAARKPARAPATSPAIDGRIHHALVDAVAKRAPRPPGCRPGSVPPSTSTVGRDGRHAGRHRFHDRAGRTPRRRCRRAARRRTRTSRSCPAAEISPAVYRYWSATMHRSVIPRFSATASRSCPPSQCTPVCRASSESGWKERNLANASIISGAAFLIASLFAAFTPMTKVSGPIPCAARMRRPVLRRLEHVERDAMRHVMAREARVLEPRLPEPAHRDQFRPRRLRHAPGPPRTSAGSPTAASAPPAVPTGHSGPAPRCPRGRSPGPGSGASRAARATAEQ